MNMTKIYLGSCHELIDQKIIDGVCDFFIKEYGLDKNDLFFYSTNGIELGDVLCLNYLNKNDFPRKLLRPLDPSRRSIMTQCDYSILFNSHRKTDAGHANGVTYSLPDLAMNIRKKIIEVHLNINSISVYDCENRRRVEHLKPKDFLYEFDENGKIIVETMLEKMRIMVKLHKK